MAGRVGRRGSEAIIESWFRKRGIPLLHADENPWTRVRNKGMWFLLCVATAPLALELMVGDRRYLIASVIAMLVVPLAMIVRRWRLTAVLVAPAIPYLVQTEFTYAIESLIGSLVVLGLTYLVVGYGLIPLMMWMGRRLMRSLPELRSAAARALPMLLLFVTFLLYTTEAWQVAGRLRGLPYLLTLSLFVASGIAFVATRVRGDIDGLTCFEDWDELDRLAARTGLPVLTGDGTDRSEPPAEIPLSVRERRSVLLVLVSHQAIMAAIVAAVVFVFFVILGFFSIDAAVAKSWLGDAPKTWIRWKYRTRTMVLTEELVRVAGFLAAFSGFYFAVFSASDPTIRDGLTDDGTSQLREACAVRHLARSERAAGAPR